MKRVLDFGLALLFAALPLATSPLAHAQAECPEYSFSKIADGASQVPGGNGGAFDLASLSLPAVDGAEVYFRGAGAGEDGVFAGNGTQLRRVVGVGDSLTGGGSIVEMALDFAVSRGVVDVMTVDSLGERAIATVAGSVVVPVVRFGDAVPEGGSFSTLLFVARARDSLAFRANVSGKPGVSTGVYLRRAGDSERIADSSTVIPASAPTEFSGFSDPDVDGDRVTFQGGFGAVTGVYLHADGVLTKVADINDLVPGSSAEFSGFTAPVLSGSRVAFRGTGDGSGIYVGNGGALSVVARSAMPAPGGSTFNGFGPGVAASGEEIAFSASGSGFIGLFVSRRDGLCRVIDTSTPLDGKQILELFMGRDGYARDRLAFKARFTDDSEGLFLARAPGRFPVSLLPLLLDD